MTKFKKIVLMRNLKADPGDIIERLYLFLRDSGRDVILDKSCEGTLSLANLNYVDCNHYNDNDLVIVVGGDGSLLNAARTFAPHKIPIIGINLGRLGFLVDISPEQMLDSLNVMLNGEYITEERFLLHARVLRDQEIITEQLALNDIVINNYLQTRMIEFFIHVDAHYVNHERADGIVIATPTGSTAYALSAGGPILHPTLDAITLVPICPHTLNHRPLVIDSHHTITLTMDPDSDTQAQVSFDGQANIELQSDDQIQIRRSNIDVKLLHPEGYEYFDILRAKLRWGKQPERKQSSNNA